MQLHVVSSKRSIMVSSKYVHVARAIKYTKVWFMRGVGYGTSKGIKGAWLIV